jgi:hypothetical protein
MTSDVVTYLKDFLTSVGYGTDSGRKMPGFETGPPTDALLQKKWPNGLVFVTVGDGIGLEAEESIDNPFIRVRAIGAQNDPDGAERLAMDIDIGLNRVAGNQIVGTALVYSIRRTGGRPSLLEQDSANRYHWVSTYLAKTPSGI